MTEIPASTPIGLQLARTAKSVGRAFEDALAEAGGTTPEWLILLALMRGAHEVQADIAEHVGISGPTLTHHLNRMERERLVTRTRRPEDRRSQSLELTEAGRARFARLRKAVATFDARLCAGVDAVELDVLRALLARLRGNVGP